MKVGISIIARRVFRIENTHWKLFGKTAMGIVGDLSSDQLQFFDSHGTFPRSHHRLLFSNLNRSSNFHHHRTSSPPVFSYFFAGYLVVESFASPDEIDAMRKRMEQLLDEFDCSTSSVFSTVNQVFVND